MKQESGRQKKKWLLPVLIAAAVLVIAGVVLGFVLGGQQSGSSDGTIESKIYWNVDREEFIEEETGLSAREPAEDGNYYVRFAVGGEQVELPVADKQLVNVIDSMSAMGLLFDNDGFVVEAVAVKEFATELANGLFVQEVRDDAIIVNSSIAMNGMEIKIELNENSGVYDVSPDAEVVGQLGTCDLLDVVYAYADSEGNTTDVLITEHPAQSKVYWRVERRYNDEKAMTARLPDEEGCYSIDYAVDGEIVTLKCKDVDLVSDIDGRGRYNADMGLVFDEDGYIIDTFSTNVALRGVLTHETIEVLETNGNAFYAEGQLPGPNNGKVFEGVVDENCKVYNVSDAAENFGEPTTLVPGDRIKGFSDVNGNLIYILVMNRMVDSPMYYSMERCYLINGVTTRKPVNGWYEFEMAGNGTVKKYRTQDLKLASKLDSFGYRCVGLRVNGDLIEKVYDPASIAGYYSFGAFQYVTTLMPPIIGTESLDKTASASGIILADCKVMNVTGIGAEIGAEDTVRLGDQIVAYTNAKLEVNYIVITNRMIEGTKVAWNHTRMYDDELGKTTREKVNGYYEFRVAIDGKDTVVKTSSEKLANKMDSMNPQMFALKLSGNTVQEVYPPIAATGGPTRSNWFKVKNITSEEIETYSLYGSGTTMLKPAANMKVYNISPGFDKQWGESTTLKVGDQIHALTDRNGETVIIFVRDRKVNSPLYWNKTRMYDTNTEETTRVPVDGYYVYELAVGGQLKTFKTDDKELANRIDKERIAIALKVEGDIIKQVYPAKSAKGIKQSTASWLDVMSVNGNKVYVQQKIPTASDLGEGYEISLATGCKFYNVSSYAEPFGHETSLKVGDRIHAFINDDDKVVECYIVRANTRKGGAFGHCAHCDKEVYWLPWSGDAFYQADAHYYLTHSMTLGRQFSIGDEEGKYDIVLDLNGNTLKAANRAFLVWMGSTMSILDCAGDGNLLADGFDGNGGAIMVYSGGKLNLYGGTFGRTENEKATTNGGVIYSSGEDSEVNIYGGTINGGKATMGGAIYISSGKLNIFDGTIVGSDVTRGGAIYNDSGVITMTGGTIQGANVQLGGAVYMLAGTFNMSGGTVRGGNATMIGGSFCVSTSGKLNISGGVITDGQAVRGGNIGGYGTVNIKGGTVEKGTATYGGNICGLDTAQVAISGNAAVAMGTAANGGNIYLSVVDTEANKLPQLSISGGTVTGGLTTSGKGSNIETYRGAKFTMSGGSISGDALLGSGTEVTLSGNPVVTKGKVRGLYFENNVVAKLENLGKNANICISATGAFTEPVENAENYLKNFNSFDSTQKIQVIDNRLCCGNYELCSHCNQQVVWQSWDGSALKKADGHYRLSAEKVSLDGQVNIGADDYTYGIVIDLHGKTLESAGRAFLVWKNSNLTIMDSVGGGFVKAAGLAGNAGTVLVHSGGVFNLMGGTVTLTEEHSANINGGVVQMSGDNSQINIVGGAITGGEATRGGALYVEAGLVTMLGGEISNSTASTGGNIYMNSGVFNLEGGTITGGTTTGMGGNIYLNPSAQLNISSGYITGGNAVRGGNIGGYGQVKLSGGSVEKGVANYGGNIAAIDSAKVTISGTAAITEGKAPNGGNIYMSIIDTAANVAPQLTVSGGTISGGVTTGGAGSNIETYRGAKFVMSGGSIDGDVSLATGTTVELSGTAVISKGKNCGLSLATDIRLTLGAMEDTAVIYITANGAFTQTLTDADSYLDNFHSYDDTMEIKAIDNVLHCSGTTLCAHCNQKVTWAPWTDESKSASGHYYLAEQTKSISSQYTIGSDTATYDIVLDLRGNTLQSEVRAFLVQSGSQLTVMDSASGGKIAAAGLNANAGTIMVYNGGVFNLLSGTLTRTEKKNATVNGGVIYVSGTGSTLNIQGGVVTGGAASGNGTNVYVTTGSVVTIGGNAKIDGGFWAADYESFTVTGSPKIQKTDCAYGLRLPGSKMLTVSEPAEGMVIGITASEPFAQNSDPAVLNAWLTNGYFVSDDSTKEIVVSGDKLTFADKNVNRCAMGHTSHDGIECDAQIVTWTAWEQTNSLPTAAGNYYLTAPLTVGPNNVITTEITLDLNGFDVTCAIPAGTTTARRAFLVNEGGKFAITDLSGKETPGTVKVDLDSSFATLADGCVVHANHGDFTLYNGILDVSKCYTNTRGGTAVVAMNDQTFTMYGGVIKGVQGAANTNGSTVSAYDSANVAIHGGELIGGKGKLGGNIYVSTTGYLTITGGTFKAGKLNASGHGENIYITNGTVSIGGDAQINGGICCDTPTSVTLSGKAVIKAADGSATYDIRFFSNTSVLKGDGTSMLTANGKYSTVYDADGNIESLSLMS